MFHTKTLCHPHSNSEVALWTGAFENTWSTPSIWQKTERLTPKWRLKITWPTNLYKTWHFWLKFQLNHILDYILSMKLWYYLRLRFIFTVLQNHLTFVLYSCNFKLNSNNVPVKSKLKHPPGHTPGIWSSLLPGREGIWSPLASLDSMLRVALIPRWSINHGWDGGDKLWWIQRKHCVFVVDWLKTKGLHKLCSVFEGV